MFSYLGGKKFQAKWIADILKHKTYVEGSFGGGAHWVYFAKLIIK